VPLRRVIRASVQRRRPRSSACASAHRPATARASFGASNGAPALRVELAPPVRSIRAHSHQTRGAAHRRSMGVDGRPDASLEVLCPLQRSPATSRLCVPGGATSPAIPLRPLTRVVVLLRPWHRVRACRASCDACTRFRDTVHPRTGDAGCPCGFTLGGAGPVDSARIDAARFGRDASPFSSRRCIARVRARRESCAGAFFVQPAFRYSRFGLRGLVGPLFGGRSLLGFPSRELGRQRGRSVVTRVTVSLSTPFARRRSWGFQMSLRRFGPADGRASRFHALGPTCRSSIDRSRCFSRAIGRPG
jgi:hypothetical protein